MKNQKQIWKKKWPAIANHCKRIIWHNILLPFVLPQAVRNRDHLYVVFAPECLWICMPACDFFFIVFCCTIPARKSAALRQLGAALMDGFGRAWDRQVEEIFECIVLCNNKCELLLHNTWMYYVITKAFITWMYYVITKTFT